MSGGMLSRETFDWQRFRKERLKAMKKVYTLLLVLFALSLTASAQLLRNVEVGGGYTYMSGNQGLNGFNVEGALFFTHRVALALDYDGGYDTSNIGSFQVTPVGLITSKSHLQNFLIGPRIYFPGLIQSKNKTVKLLNIFGEAQFGGSHLNTEIIQAATNTRTGTSDSAFTWMLGGGSDFRLSDHWFARGNLDFLRTHFANEGQSRVRLVLGVSYFFKPRS
jgi:hypothetical protein